MLAPLFTVLPYVSKAVIVILLVAPAISVAEPVIAKLTAVAGETVTLNGVEVVMPEAVALIDRACDSSEL